jgi:hypothetical protein
MKINDLFSAKEKGDLGEGVGDEWEGISDVVGQVRDQLGEDWDDLGNDGLSGEEQLGQDLGELEDDGTAEGKDGVPDWSETQEVNHVVDESSLLSGQLSFASTDKDVRDLGEGSLNVDRSLAHVVEDISDQLREDWDDLSNDGLTGEDQLGDNRDELSIDGTTNSDDDIPQSRERESKSLLEDLHAQIEHPRKESSLSNWLHSEGARSEAQSQKNSQHFIMFCFVLCFRNKFYFFLIIR